MRLPKSLLWILLTYIVSTNQIISQDSQPERFSKWIVQCDSKKDFDQFLKVRSASVSASQEIFTALGLYSIDLHEALTADQMKDDLKNSSSSTLNIYPDREIKLRRTPNDPDYPGQWGLDIIGMTDVWDITTGGTAPNGDDIVVAIFDDGYDISHPDYIDNIWVNDGEIPDNGIDDDGNGYVDDHLGWNATLDNDEHRVRSHGTAVAGIIGAVGDNSNQMAGVNWNVKLMLTSGGRNDSFNISDIVKAYQYIYSQRKLYNETQGSNGAYVVVSNYSGGAPNLFPEDFPSWCEIYDLLGEEGVLNFTSAPNSDVDVEVEGDLPSLCPSDYLIVVTNTDRLDQKAQNAGFGSQSIDIGAPGEGILTTATNGTITPDFSGASASAPFVAGVASLLYTVICEEGFELSLNNPASMALTMREAILGNVSAIPSLQGITTSGGRLDAIASLEAIRSQKGIGDCCEIIINNIAKTDESCLMAEDGRLTINAIGQDLRGPINYAISATSDSDNNQSGAFNFLPSDTYQITISADRDPTCVIDTVITISESLEVCPFGEFAISSIGPNPAQDFLNVNYVLDELKQFEILIYNAKGQTIIKQLIQPTSGVGQETIDISQLAEGPYFLGIRANDLVNATGFAIIR